MLIERIGNRIKREWSGWKTHQEWKASKRALRNGELSFERLEEFGKEEFGLWQKSVEIQGLLNLFRQERPERVGEIGVLHGGNTFLFMHYLTDIRTFVGVDLRLQNDEKLRYFCPDGVRFSLLQGDSAGEPVLGSVAESLDGKPFDCLFIDGDHSYDGVRRDFKAYRSMVRPGGLIAFHDIVPDEVARGLKTREESPWNAGEVYRFWAEIKQDFEHHEFVEDRNQIGFGIGVIRLPE